MREVMLKTSFGSIVVTLDPTLTQEVAQGWLLYANSGVYSGLEWGKTIISGANYVIVFTAWDPTIGQYTIAGVATSAGHDIVDAIVAGMNPPEGTDPNIAMVLEVEYIVDVVVPTPEPV